MSEIKDNILVLEKNVNDDILQNILNRLDKLEAAI